MNAYNFGGVFLGALFTGTLNFCKTNSLLTVGTLNPFHKGILNFTKSEHSDSIILTI